MDVGNLCGMDLIVSTFLANPDGQEAAKRYFASPDGIALLKKFAATPEGRKAILSVIPVVLEGINLPRDTREMIISALPE